MKTVTKKRSIHQLLFILLIIFIPILFLIFIGIYLKTKTGFDPSDFRINWQALIRFQPPFIVASPLRVIHIDFSNREKLDEALNTSKTRIDIWSISKGQLFGMATDTNITKLKKAGLQVTIDYATYAEYMKNININQNRITPTPVPLFCGGIVGIPCPTGFTCQLDSTYPDAGGNCIPIKIGSPLLK